MRAKPIKLSRQRHHQVRYVHLGTPGALSSIKHDRQHRRQLLSSLDPLRSHEVLPQQAHVNKNPQRHPWIHFGLELQEQVDVDPPLLPPDPPDDVVLPVTQVIRNEARSYRLQGFQVEFVHELLGDKTREQITDHLGLGEEKLVAVVVYCHWDRSFLR